MQPRNLLETVVEPVVDLLEGVVGLEPQAAAKRASTLRAATVVILPLTVASCARSGTQPPWKDRRPVGAVLVGSA